jgi:hypothetical protein
LPRPPLLAFLTHWKQINAKHIAQGVKEFGAKGMPSTRRRTR